MANKLTDLTELAAQPVNGDFLYVVDVSDSTDSPEGSSKKVTASRIYDKARNILLGEAITIDGFMEIKKSATDIQFDFLASTAGIALDVRDLADQTIFQIEGDTGNINIPVGDLSVSNGSVSCDGLAIANGHNITIGDLSIESVNNSIDLGAASTLAIRDNSDANLLTITEDTGNVEVVSGNLIVDTLSIESGGNIDLATASNLTVRDNSNTILVNIDEANGNLIVNEGQLRAYGAQGLSVTPGNLTVGTDITLASTAGTVTANGYAVVESAGDPSISNVPLSHSIVYRDTNTDTIYLIANIGGTLYTRSLAEL